MVDTLTPARRSERMSRIRSYDTSPELAIRKALHGLGLRFQLGNTKLPGKPDLIFPRYGVALFVHGCFWHRHEGCKVANMPKSNTSFWKEKFDRNRKRDAASSQMLKQLSWRVEVVWECELQPRNITATAQRVAISIRD